MSGFRERKAERVKWWKENIESTKKRLCVACNGSGRYDSNGSPKCSSCGGSGKERYKPTNQEGSHAA